MCHSVLRSSKRWLRYSQPNIQTHQKVTDAPILLTLKHRVIFTQIGKTKRRQELENNKRRIKALLSTLCVPGARDNVLLSCPGLLSC